VQSCSQKKFNAFFDVLKWTLFVLYLKHETGEASNGEWFNIYHNGIGGSVTELQNEFCVPIMCDHVKCYQSYKSGVCGQRVIN